MEKQVHKCFLCEKVLESVNPDTESFGCPGQSWGGGEARLSFAFGSRYDYIGFREPIRGGPVTKIKLDENGPEFDYQDIIGHKPRIETLTDEPRAIRLASCSHIIADICDECYEAKCHLFKGYEKGEDDNLKLLVD